MDERFERSDEERTAEATLAGAGAVLIGVGVALAYLLSKRLGPGHGGGDRVPTVRLTIEEDGSVSHCDALRLVVDPNNPNIPYVVRWLVTNRGDRRILSFENFEREDDRRISPLDREPPNRIRPVPPRTDHFPVTAAIARGAVAELLASGQREHHYEYDIWIDRVRRLDPEIVIIRGSV